jgi:hypothetical protein
VDVSGRAPALPHVISVRTFTSFRSGRVPCVPCVVQVAKMWGAGAGERDVRERASAQKRPRSGARAVEVALQMPLMQQTIDLT